MAKGATRFTGGKILRQGALRDEELWVYEGKIVEPAAHFDHEVDVLGCILAPGYIDLQVNGAYGKDFGSDPDALAMVGEKLLRHGVTSFLPTLVSLPLHQYQHCLPLLKSAPLGIHLEGPFLNPAFAGAHAHLLPLQDYETFENVKMVTLAPELALKIIPTLRQKGVVVSAGHTNATYREAKEAIAHGLSSATHLFNAMRPFHHREPGLIGAVLEKPGLPFSIIADSIHLHPATVKIAWQANPEGLFLISDAMAALGLGEGLFKLGGQSVIVKDNIATLLDRKTLAGSIVGLDQAVRNFRAWTGCTIPQALEAASLKPARLLGLEGVKGCLEVGADADLIVLDQELRVMKTYLNSVLYNF